METLEELALTNIAAYLWNINSIPDIENENDWFQTEKNIKEKVKIAGGRQLSVSVADKLSDLIRIVGNEIFKFMYYLHDTIGIDDMKLKLIVSRSCWMKGAILDSTKTVYKAIKSEELCETRKFQLVSYFCIESCIQESWNNLSDRMKTLFLNPINRDLTVENVWAFTLTSQENKFEDTLTYYRCQCINEYVIINLVETLSVDAINFFLKKISQDRKQLILKCALQSINDLLLTLEHVYGDHTLYRCFQANVNSLIACLFSQIENEYLEEVLDIPIPTSRILKCYLDWPYQKNFLEIAQIVKCYMKDEDFEFVSDFINSKIESGYKDFDYPSLLDQNNKFTRSILNIYS